MFWRAPAFERFLQRVSANYYDWIDLRTTLDIEPYYAPVAELHLFNRWPELIDRALQLLRLDRPLACTERVSTQPVHDGFVAMLELTPAAAPANAGPEVRAFIERESARYLGSYLRDCYGHARRDEHEVFALMDYPDFDQGTVVVGFGLMIDKGEPATRWLWSRVAFAHK